MRRAACCIFSWIATPANEENAKGSPHSSQTAIRMAKATPIATFSDELITRAREISQLNLSNARRKSLERILHEWAQSRLAGALCRGNHASIVRKRLARAESVKKHALNSPKALDALDDTDRFAVNSLVSSQRRHGESRAEIARQRNRLVEGTQFIFISRYRTSELETQRSACADFWLHISYFWTLLQSSNG